ncbi:unnamed protein product [Ambrosiozyma monospora]|uniref:Unnamed protein product n=1 Tax=Ambrosiozyma monospora TaxID=43982 RepID=A0ACB5T4A5_AMBMO|nr:unnamed protein product [Ambrosiozyma monospora]
MGQQQHSPTRSAMRGLHSQSMSNLTSSHRYDSSIRASPSQPDINRNSYSRDPNRSSRSRMSPDPNRKSYTQTQMEPNRSYNRSPTHDSTRSGYGRMSESESYSPSRSHTRSPTHNSHRISDIDPGRSYNSPLPPIPGPSEKSSSSSFATELYSTGRMSENTFPSDHSESDEDEDKSLPPIPPKHQVVAAQPKDNFKSSYTQRLLDASTISTDTEKSSFFGHSDFSATSAGSYMRHRESKMQNKFQDLEEPAADTAERQELLQQLFEENNKTKHPNFFKKIMGSKREGASQSLDDQIFGSSVAKMAELGLADNDDIPFGASASHHFQNPRSRSSSPTPPVPIDSPLTALQRTKTLGPQERSARKSRALEDDCTLILQPHKAISSLNSNEIDPTHVKRYNIDATPLKHVDKYIMKLPIDRFSTLEDIVADRIQKKFTTELELLRAIYCYLTTKFTIKLPQTEKLSTKQGPSASTLNDIMHSKRCTQHQLTWIFHIMASYLDIDTEIVLGRFKRPFEYDPNNTSQDAKASLELNHSWNSVLIDGEYRLIDVAMANPTNPIVQQELDVKSESSIQDIMNFYFLAKPLDMVYTHIPLHIENQHIMPPIDPIMQMELPAVYPSFVTNKLRLYKFNQAVFRLVDYEIIDFDLEIPMNYEVKCLMIPFDKNANNTIEALVQIYWKRGRRIAKIKSILPPRCAFAFASVYGRDITTPLNNMNSSTGSNHSAAAPIDQNDEFSLLLSVPAFHKGNKQKHTTLQLLSIMHLLKHSNVVC